MQVFKLVKPGVVDKVIAFDSLPSDLLTGIRTVAPNGFPRHWKRWLKEVESVATYTVKDDKSGFNKTWTEEAFYVLEYTMVNKDKERWQEIVNYVRRNCDPSIRLLDKFEDMAKPLAQDAYQPLELEPEDVPTIPIGEAKVEVEEESSVEPLVKRRRVKKEEVTQT